MNSIRICINIMKRLSKDPLAILLILIVPLAGAVLSSFMFNKENLIKVSITNSMSTPSIISVLEETNKYQIDIVNEEEIEGKLKNKKTEIGIIPSDSLEKTKILCNKQNNAVNELNLILDSYFNAEANVPLSLNKDIGSSNQASSMGFLLMAIFMFAGSCMGIILDDRKGKTFMRIFCSPIKSQEIILGNILASVFLSSLQILLFLVLSKYVLLIDYGISIPVLFLVLMAFFLASLGINIALTNLVKSNQALSIVNFTMAGCFSAMGGSFLPVSLMSPTMKAIANFVPHKWFMDSYDKLSSGGSFNDIYINILILLLFGAVFSTFGIKTLRFEDDVL